MAVVPIDSHMYLFDNEARGSPRNMVCFNCRHLMQRVITINQGE
jgi:hypothetical protein